MAEIPFSLQPSAPVEQPVPQANAPAPGTVPLMRIEDKTVIHVPITDVDVAVRSGVYAPQNEVDFNVVDDTGTVSAVKGQHLNEVLNSGYRLEDPKATHQRQIQAKYGDQGLRTFAEGFGSSASLGATDVASRVAGVSAEDLAGREEANPVWSVAGQVAGFIPGLFTGSSEVGLAAKAIKVAGAPTRLISKAAQVAEANVAKAITKQGVKAGLEKGVTRSIVEKMAAAGAGGAVEGAFLGAGQLVHESALGKADFNAENLASYATLGGLIGGGFGAAVGGAIAGLGKVGSTVAEKIGGAAENFTNKEKAAFEILGYTPAQISKLDKRRPGFRQDLVQFLEKDVGLQALDSPDALNNKLLALKEEAGLNIGTVYKQADELAESAPGLKFSVSNMNKEIAQKLDDAFFGKESQSVIAKRENVEIRKYFDDLLEHSGGRDLNFSELQALRMEADNFSRMDKLQIQRTPKQQAYYEARNYYADKLREGMQAASELSQNPQLFENFTKNNKVYSMVTEVEPHLEKRVNSKARVDLLTSVVGGASVGGTTTGDFTGMTAGGLAGFAGRKFLMSDMRRNLVVLGKIEKAQQAMNKAMDVAVKGFFGPAGRVAEPATIKTILSHELGKSPDGKKPKDTSAAYQNFLKTMDMYEQNPEAFMQRVNRSTALMQDAAPNTAAALDATAVRGVMFLGSKLPKRKAQPGMLDMLKKPKMPSNYDMAKFHRYLTAVDDPKSVVKSLENGKITHEGVEALQVVYPTLYAKLQEKVIQQLQEGGDTLTYNKRVQLGSLFNVAADDSMLPENILGLQGNFGTPESQNGAESAPIVKPTAKGLQNLNIADRMETDLNKSEV
jgi:hypothetical protein